MAIFKLMFLFLWWTAVIFFLVCGAVIGWLYKSVTSVNKWPSQWGKGRAMEEHTQQSLVIYVGIEKITILQDDRQHLVWACVTVYVSDTRVNGVCSAVRKWEGKLTFSITYPPIPFPHWFGLFKSCCQRCLSASLSLCLGLRELLSTFWHTDKLQSVDLI